MKTSFLALTLMCTPNALLAMDVAQAAAELINTLEGNGVIFNETGYDLERLTIMRSLVEHGAPVDCTITKKTLIAHALSRLPYPKELDGKFNSDFIGYDRILSLLALGAPITPEEMGVLLPDIMPINYTIIFNCPKQSYPNSAFLGAVFEAAVNGGLLAPSRRFGLESNFEAMIGENLNLQDNILQMTPLMWAAARGNIKLAKQLLSWKADLRKTDRWGYTALHFAILNGHTAMVELLLQQSSTLRLARSVDGKTPTDLAISSKKSVEMLRTLSKKR